MQVVLASPVSTAASGTAGTCTVTVNETGVAHLCDMVLGCIVDDVAGPGTIDHQTAQIIEGVFVLQITLNGSTLFVSGRNTAAAPGGYWSGLRRANFVNLPDIEVESGDTIVITYIYTRTNLDSVAFSAGIPFTPRRFKGYREAGIMGRPGQFEKIAASPSATMDGGGADTTLTITFDQPGLIDLSRLSTCSLSTLPSTSDADGYGVKSHTDAPLNLNQLILRSDYNIVVSGTATPTCPAAFNWARSKNFFKLGVHRVTPGDTLVGTWDLPATGTTLDGLAAMAVPLAPDAGFKSAGKIGGRKPRC